MNLSPGVLETAVGYTGGATPKPTYEDVCTDGTGHAEAVEVEFDPARVTYEKLLDVFWQNHDPTQKNRQGPDVGDQYRSAIYVHDSRQREIAEQTRQRLDAEHRFRRPIVTEIAPLTAFYKAEDYHQDYFAKNPEQGYCRVVVAPKVKKFEKLLQEQNR